MKKLIKIILICVLVLTAVTVSAAAIRQLDGGWRLSVQLHGPQVVYLEYGQTYEEPGALAEISDGNSTQEVPVTIRGTVDTHRTGRYYIKYTAYGKGRVRTEYRCVRVVDTEAPVITLTQDPNAYTLVNEPYKEEGFTAADNYDGDLTAKVIRKESDGIVTYSVTDSSGNTTTVTRTINYVDPSLPQIDLEGGQIAFILAGDNYTEPGYTATDSTDGDLTPSVVVSGAVDNLTSGIYTLQYAVTNSRGMTSTLNRTVYVVPRPESEDTEQPDEDPSDSEIDLPTGGTAIEPNGKVIYLTFDDGPSRHTGRLLDVLAKYGVKATFFVVQTSYPEMITRAAQEGHTVAIHTYSHQYNKIYASDEAFMADLEAIQNVIFQYTGQKAMLTRFPGGSSNSVSSAYNRGIMSRLTKKLPAMGYQYFDWNVDSNDAGGARTADEVFQNVTKGIGERNNSVVLQHDTQGFSVDAVERIIAWGLCNGYTFQPLTADSPTCHHYVNN